MSERNTSGRWSFDKNQPIFKQISDRLKLDIAAGRYAPGDKFPSVREFAIEIGVNPNTVQRALASMEEEGILETKRGDGRYVMADSDGRNRISRELRHDLCAGFIESMRATGLTDGEILNTLAGELQI